MLINFLNYGFGCNFLKATGIKFNISSNEFSDFGIIFQTLHCSSEYKISSLLIFVCLEISEFTSKIVVVIFQRHKKLIMEIL